MIKPANIEAIRDTDAIGTPVVRAMLRITAQRPLSDGIDVAAMLRERIWNLIYGDLGQMVFDAHQAAMHAAHAADAAERQIYAAEADRKYRELMDLLDSRRVTEEHKHKEPTRG